MLKLQHIVIGFLICLLSVIVLTTFNYVPVYAASTNETNTTVSVTVAMTVDVTLTNTSIAFGSVNLGSVDNANTNNPTKITIEPTTNIATNVSLRGWDFTYGANIMGIGNLTYSNDTAKRQNMTTSYVGGSTFKDWTSIAVPTGRTNVTALFWIRIPSAQVAGEYYSNVSIKVGQFA